MAASRVLSLTALVLVVVLGGCRELQDRFLYYPAGAPTEAPVAPRGWTVEPLTLTRPGDIQLRGWLVKPAAARASLLIYFGGNGEEVSWQVPKADRYGTHAVALVNYRGYGESTGRPSEAAFFGDALALFDALGERADIDASRVAVMGRSLGSGVAVHVAALRRVERVVLVSPYDSVAALAAMRFPAPLVRMFLSDRYDSAALAPAVRAPLLVIAAGRDDIIPVVYSRRLYDLWGGPKQWIELPRARHLDLQEYPEYWQAITAFLAPMAIR